MSLFFTGVSRDRHKVEAWRVVLLDVRPTVKARDMDTFGDSLVLEGRMQALILRMSLPASCFRFLSLSSAVLLSGIGIRTGISTIVPDFGVSVSNSISIGISSSIGIRTV